NQEDLQAAARAGRPEADLVLKKDLHLTQEIRFHGRNRRVTIRSEDPKKPVRILFDAETAALTTPTAALRGRGGDCRLEAVQLEVRSGEPLDVERGALAVEGGGHVTCKNCFFSQATPRQSLHDHRKKVPVASVAVRRKGTEPPPRVELSGC